MKPLITVIVPVYNVEGYLNRCVESIANQSYRNLEIILVDDGSRDGCPGLCDTWVKSDSRIKVIHKKNGGVSSARNAGLDIACGEYIAFVDADDYISPNMLEKLLNGAILNNCDISICRVSSDESAPNEQAKVYENDVLSLYLSDSLCRPSVFAKLYSRQVIQGLRFDPSIKIGEDYIFNFYAFKNARRVVVLEERLYYYELRENSAVHTLNKEMLDRWKNTKSVLESGLLTDKQYSVLLCKYSGELFCIAREILKTKNKALINSHFGEITDEIKKYSNDFTALNISRANRMGILLLKISPNLFKMFFMLYFSFNTMRTK